MITEHNDGMNRLEDNLFLNFLSRNLLSRFVVIKKIDSSLQ
jgi:hypothetical protein